MQRFLPLIAALFTLASVWGGASGYAMAYSSDMPGVTIPAGDDFCLAPLAESDPVVSFKVCGKKKTGIVMPCNGHPGILADACVEPVDAARDDHVVRTERFTPSRLILEQLKPPIAG
ncbi:hypothetical protein [Devosia sp. LC5]|uniref:hypothetical protein n=1 Tax=Devosia sp. LC5 TaxID=1502724 RepID=UPI001268019F|nr:hypothetical protein [Devosia sp. LC5]